MRYALVLDLDDTLFLERDYMISGFRAVEKYLRVRIGLKHFAEAAFSEFLRGNRGKIFDAVLEANGVIPHPEIMNPMIYVYRNHTPNISLPDDSVRLLTSVTTCQELAVVTDGYLCVQKRKARALALGKYVKHILYTDKLGRQYWKPHKRAFVKLEQIFKGVERRKFVYVADNPTKDFSAPAALGWWTIRIRREGGLYCGLENVGDEVDREITELGELNLSRLERGLCP